MYPQPPFLYSVASYSAPALCRPPCRRLRQLCPKSFSVLRGGSREKLLRCIMASVLIDGQASCCHGSKEHSNLFCLGVDGGVCKEMLFWRSNIWPGFWSLNRNSSGNVKWKGIGGVKEHGLEQFRIKNCFHYYLGVMWRHSHAGSPQCLWKGWISACVLVFYYHTFSSLTQYPLISSQFPLVRSQAWVSWAPCSVSSGWNDSVDRRCSLGWSLGSSSKLI